MTVGTGLWEPHRSGELSNSLFGFQHVQSLFIELYGAYTDVAILQWRVTTHVWESLHQVFGGWALQLSHQLDLTITPLSHAILEAMKGWSEEPNSFKQTFHQILWITIFCGWMLKDESNGHGVSLIYTLIPLQCPNKCCKQ